MADEWVAGVDASYDTLGDADAQALKDAGIKVFIQCLWTAVEQPAPAINNLRVAQRNGLIIAGYASINGSRPGAWHILQAYEKTPKDIWDALKKVAVDVELKGIKVADIRAAVEAAHNFGKPKDIYTSYGFWTGQGNLDTPGSTGFQDCGLWNALWDGDPDIDFPRLPYGGWRLEDVWGEQYNGGREIAGFNVDSDQFRASAFGLGQSEEPEKESIVELVWTEGPAGVFLWATDWLTKHYIADAGVVPAKVLMDKGIWPAPTQTLKPQAPLRAAFDALERGVDY